MSRIPRLVSLTRHQSPPPPPKQSPVSPYLALPVTPSRAQVPYSQTQFARTEESVNTIRRFTSSHSHSPLTPLQSTPPSILTLDVDMKCNYANVDAQFEGECIVQTTIRARYTNPPAKDGASGFDGVILVDESVTGQKRLLRQSACEAIIEATSSNDRLGLVTFGDRAITVSELIMCTSPYKQALQQSISEATESKSSNKACFGKGIDTALKLLEKDARNGGHIFLISDGHPSFTHTLSSQCKTTLHIIAIGSLTCPTQLRKLRHQIGAFLEFRNSAHDEKRIENLVNDLRSQVYPHSIDTVRCRLIAPPNISILEVINFPITLESQNQIAITLCTSSLPPPSQQTLMCR